MKTKKIGLRVVGTHLWCPPPTPTSQLDPSMMTVLSNLTLKSFTWYCKIWIFRRLLQSTLNFRSQLFKATWNEIFNWSPAQTGIVLGVQVPAPDGNCWQARDELPMIPYVDLHLTVSCVPPTYLPRTVVGGLYVTRPFSTWKGEHNPAMENPPFCYHEWPQEEYHMQCSLSRRWGGGGVRLTPCAVWGYNPVLWWGISTCPPLSCHGWYSPVLYLPVLSRGISPCPVQRQ